MKKTYYMAIGVAIVSVAYYLGFINADMYKMGMGLFNAGGLAALRAGVNKGPSV